MYIEFQLPPPVASLVSNLLSKHIQLWATQYQIPYTKKVHKYTVRITFDQDQHYDFFALTWNPDSRFPEYLLDYRFVEPMRRV